MRYFIIFYSINDFTDNKIYFGNIPYSNNLFPNYRYIKKQLEDIWDEDHSRDVIATITSILEVTKEDSNEWSK